MKKRLKTAIPEEFLLKMGTHNVSIHGVNVTAHVVDSKAAVDKHIASFRDPPLIKWSLSNLSHKVGVLYKGSSTQTNDMEVDSDNPKVFSDDQVIAAASDAYANFQIGFKLLNSLPSSDAKPKLLKA